MRTRNNRLSMAPREKHALWLRIFRYLSANSCEPETIDYLWLLGKNMPCGCGLFDISDNLAGTPAHIQVLMHQRRANFPVLPLPFTYLSFYPYPRKIVFLKAVFSFFSKIGHLVSLFITIDLLFSFSIL